MPYLGIDPGLSGAMALLSFEGELNSVIDMPTLGTTATRRVLDEHRILEFLRFAQEIAPGGPLRAVVERAMVMPGQGSSSGLKIGTGYGILLGMLSALSISRVIVTPQVWQKAMLGQCPKGTSKDRARARAQELFPKADLGKRKSQDRSDALLLALYGQRFWTTPSEASQDAP